MNFQSILSIVMTLLGKREELVKLVQDAIKLFNNAKELLPMLGDLTKEAPAATAPTMSITWLQESLNKLTDAKLTVDGKYGQATQDAVKKFQTANGLTADGWAGVQTQAAIVSALQEKA
jgi:peptidoglycan hydrolase-like protein with peptidoglycan-binding domain